MSICDYQIAILTVLIAYCQWLTNEKKRRQELFNMRMAFYDELKNVYFSLEEKKKENPYTPYLQIEDICSFLTKGLWLFGEDMRKAINDLEGTELSEIDRALDCLPENVEKVFAKYMTIEKKYNLWGFIKWIFCFLFSFRR